MGTMAPSPIVSETPDNADGLDGRRSANWEMQSMSIMAVVDRRAGTVSA